MHPWFAEIIAPDTEDDSRGRARRRRQTRVRTIVRRPTADRRNAR
ncbi:hypothetical protein ACIBH1_04510 [Nonomuraea sp. NPDC050663]